MYINPLPWYMHRAGSSLKTVLLDEVAVKRSNSFYVTEVLKRNPDLLNPILFFQKYVL